VNQLTAPIVAIGVVTSPLVDLADAPRQPDEPGAAPARLVIDAAYRDGIDGLAVGDEIVVLTWLHLANREALVVHPRDDLTRPATGVFATRSQHRPNPIGLHHATITAITPDGITVEQLEAISGTPILDVKPVLGPPSQR
jgi:tRNA-Thr(GGU) m(6)t(6)A37 methyltransferase TsaA